MKSLRIALAATVCACAASAAGAQELFANTYSYGSSYVYNTTQGVVSATGSSSGSTGTGNPVAVSQSTYSLNGSTGDAYASADYATGGLHAAALTTGPAGDAAAFAALKDSVTFNVAGASAGTPTLVGLDLHLVGSISVEQSASFLYNFKMYGSGFPGASVGWTTAFLDSPSDPRNYVGWATSGGAGAPNGFVSWQMLVDTATEKIFHGVFEIFGPSTTLDIETGLNLRCSNGTDCDFSHSAHLDFDLPPNVGFTSASGLLLTGSVAAPVPEPSSLALMVAGLGFVGEVARRRRRA